MKTILNLLKKAGGWRPSLYIKIENPPYLPLVIEAVDESGPLGLPAVSVCHYGEQNGDAMRDPEMCFELGLAGGAHLIPYFWRNDFVAVEQVSRAIIRGHYVALLDLQKQHEKFAATWDTISDCKATRKPLRTSAFSAKQDASRWPRTCGDFILTRTFARQGETRSVSACTRFRLLPAPARRLRVRTPGSESAPAQHTAVQS